MSNSDGLPKEVRETTQDIAEGSTRAVIKFGKEEIKRLAQRFLNSELIFIEDQDTIDLVKRQLKSGEWNFFSNYVKNKKLKLLIGMELTLRELEKQNEKDQLENLRDKIYFKHKEDGLHVAQFVQCKLLVTYLSRIIDNCSSTDEIVKKIEDMLNNLETRVSFIQLSDDVDIQYSIIISRLDSNAPEDYLVFARESALSIGHVIRKKLGSSANKHGYEMESKQSKTSLILILSKIKKEV